MQIRWNLCPNTEETVTTLERELFEPPRHREHDVSTNRNLAENNERKSDLVLGPHRLCDILIFLLSHSSGWS